MKKLIGLMIVMLVTGTLISLLVIPVGAQGGELDTQVPQLINYQAYLTDSGGSPIDATDLQIRFTIYEDNTGTTYVWRESQLVDVNNGLFTVALGSGTPIYASMFADTNGDGRYLGVKVSTDDEMTPLQKMTTVSYAFFADEANNTNTLDNLDSNDFIHLAPSAAQDIPATTALIHLNEQGGSVPDLIDLKVDGASRFTVNNAGNTTIDGTTTSLGDLYLSGIGSDDDTIFFDYKEYEHFKWFDSKDAFFLSNDLDVSGTVGATAFVGNGSKLYGVPGDNLGSHTATQNIKLNGHYLSGDGGNEGIYIDSVGNVGIGIPNPSHKLEVTGYNIGYAAVRGAAQNTDTYAEGQLGVYGPTVPGLPTNVGVLGIKPSDGADGVAVYAHNYDDDATANYAMYSVANGTSTGTNYGIYSTASNGATNYAGYFDGDIAVMNGNVGIGDSTPEYPLDIETSTFSSIWVDNPVGHGLYVKKSGGNGVWVLDADNDGVNVNNAKRHGVYAYGGSDSTDFGGYFIGANGVYGYSNASPPTIAHGVYGATDNAWGYGGYFTNSDGVGLYGAHTDPTLMAPAIYAENTGYGHGVYATSGTMDAIKGVATGTEAYGVVGKNTNYNGVYGEGSTAGWNYGGYFVGFRGVYGDGSVYGFYTDDSIYVGNDLYVVNNAEIVGDLDVYGVKNFIQPHPVDPTKEIAYVSLEGGEAGTYVRGTSQLVDGTAEIVLPEHFSLVTAAEGITVQVTPLEDCNGIFVIEKSSTRIVIREMQGGSSNASFDFTVMGIRTGYEDYEPIRDKKELVEEEVQGEFDFDSQESPFSVKSGTAESAIGE